MHDLTIGDDAHALAHSRGHTRLPLVLQATLDASDASAGTRHCVIDLWTRSVVDGRTRTLALTADAQRAGIIPDVTVGEAVAELVAQDLIELVGEADGVTTWHWLIDAAPPALSRNTQPGTFETVSDAERAKVLDLVVGKR